jgi:hypothetical protein
MAHPAIVRGAFTGTGGGLGPPSGTTATAMVTAATAANE